MNKIKNYTVSVKEILSKIDCELICGNEDEEFLKFSTDSRMIEDGTMYIGLQGEKVNGGIFFEDAFSKGAKGVIIQGIEITQETKEKYKDKVIVKVEDTLVALQEIAKIKRKKYDIPVIAVTGSVGKTSTKDIIANVLSQKYKTLKTEGNFNNHIGVPLTILRLEDHEAAVIEMGMNHFGEIRVLTNIAKPTICVMTNIGTSHIGILGSRENILKSKLEILEGNKEKQLILNNDNDLLHDYYINNKEVDITTYGLENESDIYATEIIQEEENTLFSCNIKDTKIKINVPVGGIHFVYNALCAATVGKKLGLTDIEIKKGIETFELTKKRMDINILNNGCKIINDAYNASYESMNASIINLSKYSDRKIAVLGDMFELGDFSEELHRKVGSSVAQNNIDILICAGENAKNIVAQAKQDGMDAENIYYFKDKNEIIVALKNIIKNNDIILFKASNGMKFFELAEKLKEMLNNE